MSGRIEGYSYSEGVRAIAAPPTAAPPTCVFDSTQTLAVIEQATPGTTTYARPSVATRWADLLTLWGDDLSLAAPAGAPAGTYAVSYSQATKRVTIASTNATSFRPVMPADQAHHLGFTQALAGWALSWVGESQPQGVLECAALEVDPAEDASRVDLQRYRHQRVVASVWGNAMLHRLRVWIRQADAAPVFSGGNRPGGHLSAGRLRVWQATADLTPYSATNPHGYLDGYVVATTDLQALDDSEGVLRFDALLAVARY